MQCPSCPRCVGGALSEGGVRAAESCTVGDIHGTASCGGGGLGEGGAGDGGDGGGVGGAGTPREVDRTSSGCGSAVSERGISE